MKISKQKIIIILIILGAVAISLGYYFFASKDSSGESKDMEIFTKCLSDKGIKLYGAFWCSHCQNQKKIFGDSVKNINYIECSTPDKKLTDACNQAGVNSFPTWEFQDGEKISGELTLQEISDNSGCPLN